MIFAASGLLPEAQDFPDAVYLEFGWGDRRYYPATDVTVGMTLKAALVPTDAIMHIAGLSHVTAFDDANVEVAAVRLSDDGVMRMAAAIAD